ncbi:hypothetical protein Pmani_019264 [Petrolisthes manimaculis]|uniref:Uncharacterized protein n=1 Tax=Petrolisthes manimaculis TaxID=1843537 RepID=A0AAE1PL21_9EUCA|nr:hypothetical protein Pmani_019264 [Petrolisthes manimaculis]
MNTHVQFNAPYPKHAEDEDEEDVGDAGVDDVANTQKVLTAKLEDLRTCHDLILKHGTALHKSLGELEALEPGSHDLTAKTKTVNERATLFRISSNAMINSGQEEGAGGEGGKEGRSDDGEGDKKTGVGRGVWDDKESDERG